MEEREMSILKLSYFGTHVGVMEPMRARGDVMVRLWIGDHDRTIIDMQPSEARRIARLLTKHANSADPPKKRGK